MHEALGHYGLRGVFGKQLDGVLEQVAAQRRAEIVAKGEEYGMLPKHLKDATLGQKWGKVPPMAGCCNTWTRKRPRLPGGTLGTTPRRTAQLAEPSVL